MSSLKISVFTPSHRTSYLLEVWNSLKDQVFFEWVIALNNGAELPSDFLNDPRIRALRVPQVQHEINGVVYDTTHWIGYLKNWACSQCAGDILVELDHDDLLMPNALEEVRNAFESDPEIGFVYSNSLQVTADLQHSIERYGSVYGWQYRQVKYEDRIYDECISFKPIPSAVSLIWYAPDHIRAFRRTVYKQVGGYNRGMDVLDDQDLMCRMYLVTKFHHIDKPLYIYRFADNTHRNPETFNKIQRRTVELRDLYLQRMVEAWSRREGYRLVELGGRIAAAPGYETMDLFDADIIGDLNEKWPFEDNSIGVIRSFDVFEHLPNIMHTMSELHRVLAPGGMAYIQVPSTDGRGAFQAPDHVSFWNENSFLYFTDAYLQNFIPNVKNKIRFQAIKCFTTEMNHMKVCWVNAIMMKLGNDRVPGIINI